MTRIGIVLMAISLEGALFVISRLVFGSATAALVVMAVGVLMVLAWIVLPLSFGRAASRR